MQNGVESLEVVPERGGQMQAVLEAIASAVRHHAVHVAVSVRRGPCGAEAVIGRLPRVFWGWPDESAGERYRGHRRRRAGAPEELVLHVVEHIVEGVEVRVRQVGRWRPASLVGEVHVPQPGRHQHGGVHVVHGLDEAVHRAENALLGAGEGVFISAGPAAAAAAAVAMVVHVQPVHLEVV